MLPLIPEYSVTIKRHRPETNKTQMTYLKNFVSLQLTIIRKRLKIPPPQRAAQNTFCKQDGNTIEHSFVCSYNMQECNSASRHTDNNIYSKAF